MKRCLDTNENMDKYVERDGETSSTKKRIIEKSKLTHIKKKAIINRLTGMVDSPSSMATKCVPIFGSIHWTCPSRDEYSTHHIYGKVCDGKIKFESDCTGGYDNIKTGHCIHIISVIANMIQNFVTSAVSYQDDKAKYFSTVKLLNGVKLSEHI